MPLWIFLDAAVVAIYVIAITFFRTKGFLKASETVISLVLTFCLMSSVLPIFQKIITESKIGETIHTHVSDAYGGEKEETGKTGVVLPDFMQNSLQKQLDNIDKAKNDAIAAAAEGTAGIIIQVISAILLFILIKIGIFLLFRVLEVFFRLKLLNFVNRTLGIVLGIINATVIVYVLCALAAVFVPAENLAVLKTAMDKTFIAGFFYNNNMLINLFL